MISVEGALSIGGSLDALGDLWHPQISNEYKARLMDGLISRHIKKRPLFTPVVGHAFIGDLYYYMQDLTLPIKHKIDTNQVGVHILSGEYDYSGTSELGKAADQGV